MQEDFAPRVDVAHLGHFQGQVVRVVGRVVSQSGSTATLNCADSGNKSVQIQTTYGNEYNSPIVEVKGRVAGDIVEEISHVPLGENFDLANYQRLLEFSSGPFKHLFLPV